jgi:hypothetical protein
LNKFAGIFLVRHCSHPPSAIDAIWGRMGNSISHPPPFMKYFVYNSKCSEEEKGTNITCKLALFSSVNKSLRKYPHQYS